MSVDERGFEDVICDWLVAHGGYTAVKVGTAQGAPAHFDAVRGIDTAELFAFIGATQAEAWDRLVALHGEPNTAQARFADRVAQELDARGTVDVLRHGVVDLGVEIHLAFFRPAHGLTPELVERYDANRLTVTRQLPYDPSSTKTVDLALMVNGLVVATAELKNPTTGQGIENAKAQYRTRRDPRNTTLGQRAVVHFAVDTERVAMTTRLAGEATRFLPFNRGDGQGAGNPANPAGHRTAYLWQRVWARDAWMDLLGRFIHTEPVPKGSRRLGQTIFPRFHQWDAVLALTADAGANGAGPGYLVQHSAGSGKSNTIAWLAHRLTSLHDATDTRVFDKVVVISDRRVLDRQLQDTIHQFERTWGVVVKIDQDSRQLAEALEGEQARVIVTTLQKFPVVRDLVASLPQRRYAVIVDEAHSSQTGEAAKDLKAVLGSGTGTPSDEEAPATEAELARAEVVDAGFAGEAPDPAQDALAEAVAARVRQDNLSFFAFTATPKGRTLELFGRYDRATGRHEPFHLYSMRQAIEEGFILDVLASYLTYETYWNIERATLDDPAYDSAKAKAAIAKFVSLHERNLAQKAQIIIEHFRSKVSAKIGGKAKAMVVTSSRLHAVRYKLALDRYLDEHGYRDVGVLVAFSGTVDPGGEAWTEAAMNGVPESQTVAAFAGDEAQILVVAEKYQTGVDQPLLYAMYVDKPLTGLAAVQTLSRLNRTADGKDGTFVLDFRNDAEDIRAAFEPWYGRTVAPPTDPNLLYDTRREVERFGLLWPDEVEAVVAALLVAPRADHARVNAALAPAVDRFWALDADEQDAGRDALNRFVRTYAFLSQVVAFTDTKLERDYLYAKALAPLLRTDGGAGLDLGREVELTHLRHEQTFEGSVALAGTEGEVATVFSGTGPTRDPDEEPLSAIIARLNERFGTDFAPEDRLFYDAIADKLAGRADIQQAAATNTPSNFREVLDGEFEGGVIDQMGISTEMAKGFLDDDEVRKLVLATYAPFIQGRAQVAHQEHCPIGELLRPDLESHHLEYKATLRTHAEDGAKDKVLETACLKTVAAFANSREGGTLLIGVDDDGSVHGLESDHATLAKPGKEPADLFQLHLGDILEASLGGAAAGNVRTWMHAVEGRDLCRVHVPPSGFPVDATVTLAKKGGHEHQRNFYVRVGNATKALNEEERRRYIEGHWPGR